MWHATPSSRTCWKDKNDAWWCIRKMLGPSRYWETMLNLWRDWATHSSRALFLYSHMHFRLHVMLLCLSLKVLVRAMRMLLLLADVLAWYDLGCLKGPVVCGLDMNMRSMVRQDFPQFLTDINKPLWEYSMLLEHVAFVRQKILFENILHLIS